MKVLLVVAALMFLVGCGALFGLHTDPKTGDLVSDGTGGIVGKIGGTFWPWAGTAFAGLVGVFAEVKRRNWKGAAKSTREAIEEFKTTPEGQRVWAKAGGLKEKLVAKHGPKISKLIDSLAPKSS